LTIGEVSDDVAEVICVALNYCRNSSGSDPTKSLPRLLIFADQFGQYGLQVSHSKTTSLRLLGLQLELQTRLKPSDLRELRCL
jgi:hypothetical protein